VLHLAGISKYAGLRVAGVERWRSSIGMNDPNGSVDGREIELGVSSASRSDESLRH
jgi:hypothetical protein